MTELKLKVGDCILCGSRVAEDMDFYETGEGYCHQFCMKHRKRAR